VIQLTKNHPIRLKYTLGPDGKEDVTEEVIEDFEPYSRFVYVRAATDADAQERLYEYMHKKKLADWKELQDGLVIE